MSAKDYYELLGVNKNATDGEIKKAYYAVGFIWFECFLHLFGLLVPLLIDAIVFQLAKQLHPDMNKDDPEAEKKFQEVSKAYEVSLFDEIVWYDMIYTEG